MDSKRAALVGSLVLGSVVSACGIATSPIATLSPDVVIECGPILDRALCVKAAEVAATAKTNPPAIVAVKLRRLSSDDPCTSWVPPCGAEAVIVQIQSGDAIEEFALTPSAGGWTLLSDPDS